MSAAESIINTLTQSVMVVEAIIKFVLFIAAFELRKLNIKEKAQLTIDSSFIVKIKKTVEEKV